MSVSVLSSIIGSASPEPLSPVGEADLIEQAQAGDHDAMLDLMRQYAPVLRKLINTYSDTMDRDDAEQELMLAFIQMVQSHDPLRNPQLAGRIYQYLTEAMAEAAVSNSSGFTIPARTMKRYLNILKRADQDLASARALAPAHGMTVHTFDAITRATRTDSSATMSTEEDERGSYAASTNVTAMFTGNPAEESAELAQFAMDAVTDEELAVVRHAYGFEPLVIDGATILPEGYAPLADGLIAPALNLSRQKVQRLRTSALATMREALAVDGEVA